MGATSARMPQMYTFWYPPSVCRDGLRFSEVPLYTFCEVLLYTSEAPLYTSEVPLYTFWYPPSVCIQGVGVYGRNSPLLEPYSRTISRTLWWS